jgi:DNA-binding response OmpR family regulator
MGLGLVLCKVHVPVSKLVHWCPHEWRTRLRILLVEDNIPLGDALQEHLSLMGWDVTWVTGYQLGADTLCRVSFDVVCLDRRLPDGDGFDLLRRGLILCPTIIMSAFDQLSDRLEAKRLGATDYLIKPFRLEELTHRISLSTGANIDSARNQHTSRP